MYSLDLQDIDISKSNYQVCSKCLKNKVGSRNAWFQDFTGQKRVCNACIDKMRKGNNP